MSINVFDILVKNPINQGLKKLDYLFSDQHMLVTGEKKYHSLVSLGKLKYVLPWQLPVNKSESKMEGANSFAPNT